MRFHLTSEEVIGNFVSFECMIKGSKKINELDDLSHPVSEGKPNANHVRARISYSRTQQLHNMDIITQCSK
jgi:hypothetical protein